MKFAHTIKSLANVAIPAQLEQSSGCDNLRDAIEPKFGSETPSLFPFQIALCASASPDNIPCVRDVRWAVPSRVILAWEFSETHSVPVVSLSGEFRLALSLPFSRSVFGNIPGRDPETDEIACLSDPAERSHLAAQVRLKDRVGNV